MLSEMLAVKKKMRTRARRNGRFYVSANLGPSDSCDHGSPQNYGQAIDFYADIALHEQRPSENDGEKGH
jgi:hypothetical protein